MIQWWQPFTPLRLSQALNAATFLIDRDGCVPANRIAHLIAQRTDLIRRLDISREQDETKRIGLSEKQFFVVAQPSPFGVENCGSKSAQRVTTGIHSAFSATKAEQKRLASFRSANPMARRR